MTFFSLLSGSDLLSCFFRTTLQDPTHSNYLLFFVQHTEELSQILNNAVIESFRNDEFSNSCCISWMNLLFSNLLRNYSQTIQFYNYQAGTDFSLILQYIQHNYQHVTLSSLAGFFHYNESYLCTLIRQNTGYSFTTLLRRLRMSKAADYLIRTDLKVREIADLVGYNSADRFSRVFKQTYDMSPQEYRTCKKNC